MTKTENYILFDVSGTGKENKNSPMKTTLRGELFIDWVDEKQWFVVRQFEDGCEEFRCITDDESEFYINLDADCRILNGDYKEVRSNFEIEYCGGSVSNEAALYIALQKTTDNAYEKFLKDCKKRIKKGFPKIFTDKDKYFFVYKEEVIE